MRALIVGDKEKFNELILKLPEHVTACHYAVWEEFDPDTFDLIFDLNFDDSTTNIKFFGKLKIPAVVGAVKIRLSETVHEYREEVRCPLIGMNLLRGFINREVSEITLAEKDREATDKLMQQLKWKYSIVQDRAGMVTPRIICMIINEAYYTLQEGTASVNDIDIAMKLGTNYPYGPFEWAEKIGIKDVYEILDAIYQDTRDERYKICPMLKTKYLNGGTF